MNYYQQNYPNYMQYQNAYQNQAQQTMQSGTLVSIPSEEDARMYPVAPGNSVTFKDENAPYIYTKTMGFSQLDRPIFEKYKLIKENTVDRIPANQESKYALKDDLANVLNKVMGLEEEILALRGDTRKREMGDVGDDER